MPPSQDFSPEKLAALLNQIGKGWNQSAETLYRHYSGALYAFIRMRIKNDEAAEELVNDTFMIAFRKPGQYDGTASFKTWLFGIAKNVCGTWIRKQQRQHSRAHVPLDEPEEGGIPLAERLMSDYKGAEALLEEAELEDALSLCVDKLPQRQRETLHWAWFEELNITEVAERMACSTGTVKAQLFHARSKLWSCLRSAFGLELSHA